MRERTQGPGFFYGWIVVGTATFLLLMSFGTSTSIGVFIRPMVEAFGWNRVDVSLPISVGYFLLASTSPFVGRLIDRRGVRVAYLFGILSVALGTALLSTTSHRWQVYLFYGVLVAMGSAGTTFVPSSAVVTRWFQRRRALALGIVSTGGPVGQLLVVPLAAFFLLSFGWRMSFLYLALLLAVTTLPLVLWVLKNDPAEMGLRPDGVSAEEEAFRVRASQGLPRRNLEHLRWPQAFTTLPFWLLSGGYFTCGFTVTLFSVHLIPYAQDLGFDLRMAASAVSLAGFFNIFGTVFAGTISDRVGRKTPLAATYFCRGLAFLIFLLWQNALTLYLFAAILGFSYFATVPLTAALTGDIYGSKNLGVLYGTITGIHQAGSAVGAYVGGLFFDLTGTYQGAFLIAFLLLMSAATLSFVIQEERYRVPVPTPFRAG